MTVRPLILGQTWSRLTLLQAALLRQNNTSIITDIQSLAGVTAFTKVLAEHRLKIHGNIMEVDTLPMFLEEVG